MGAAVGASAAGGRLKFCWRICINPAKCFSALALAYGVFWLCQKAICSVCQASFPIELVVALSRLCRFCHSIHRVVFGVPLPVSLGAGFAVRHYMVVLLFPPPVFLSAFLASSSAWCWESKNAALFLLVCLNNQISYYEIKK